MIIIQNNEWKASLVLQGTPAFSLVFTVSFLHRKIKFSEQKGDHTPDAQEYSSWLMKRLFHQQLYTTTVIILVPAFTCVRVWTAELIMGDT